MMDTQLLFLFCMFAAVSLLAYYAARAIVGSSDDEKLRTRLAADAGAADKAGEKADGGSAVPLWQRVGQAAAQPFMPKTREKQSNLRHLLGYAGIYSPSAVRMVTGFKVIFLCVGLIGGYMVGLATGGLLLPMSVGGLVGYLFPQAYLRLKIRAHQKELNYGLADALDLMVVCVEAGLTIDASVERVGREMILAHPAISREFAITHMETRVGLSRAESLKNLGQRTGCAALQSLAAMLIQADRFGTSIASALRIHAESLRANRQFAAEEMAAKAAVKMSFPLILFIFPALFIVLAGPTVIRLMESTFLN